MKRVMVTGNHACTFCLHILSARLGVLNLEVVVLPEQQRSPAAYV